MAGPQPMATTSGMIDDSNDPFQLKYKEEKICLVCGDKALANNFGSRSCESCKAFFRRNALRKKDFKCPFQGDCRIDTLTRRFCQRCRLKKCLDVGMKKEWIWSDEEKKKKREKVVENRNKKMLKLSNGMMGRESRMSMENYRQDSSLSSDDNYSPPQVMRVKPPTIIKSEPPEDNQMIYHHNLQQQQQQQNPSSQSYHPGPFDQATSAYHQQYQQYLSTKAYGPASKPYPSPPAPPQPHLAYHHHHHHLQQQQQQQQQPQSVHPATTSTTVASSFGSQDSNTSDSVSPTSDCSYSTGRAPAFPQQHPSYDYQQHPSTYNEQGEPNMRRNTLPADYSRYNVSPGTVNYRHKLTKSYVDSMATQQHHQQYRSPVSQHQQQSYGLVPAHQQTSHSKHHHQQQQPPPPQFHPNTSASQHFFEETPTFNTFYHGRNFENGSTEICGENQGVGQSRLIKQELNGYISSEDDCRSTAGGESDDNSRPLSVGGPSFHRTSTLTPAVGDNANMISTIDLPKQMPPPSTEAECGKIPRGSLTFTPMELLHLDELLLAGDSLRLVLHSADPIINMEANVERRLESLAEVFELATSLLQHLVAMTKQLSTFDELCSVDQLSLLKASMPEMLVLLGVIAFDRRQDRWVFSNVLDHTLETTTRIVFRFEDLRRIESNVPGDGFYLEARQFIYSFDTQWLEDQKICYLMLMLLLFSSNKSNLRHEELIHLNYATYHHLLSKYLEIKYPAAEVHKKHYNGIMKMLQIVPSMNETVMRYYCPRRPSPVNSTDSTSTHSVGSSVSLNLSPEAATYMTSSGTGSVVSSH